MKRKIAMRKLLLGAVSLISLGSVAPAIAADLAPRAFAPPPIVPYDWSGFYFGFNGGGSWSRNCWTNTSTFGVPTVPSFFEGCNAAPGAMFGGQAGYRWQMSSFVFGLEAQGDWANLSGSNASLFNLGTNNQSKTDALGLFTGQVGYTSNQVLWYVKGGVALADNEYNGLFAGVAFDQATETRWGSVVGAGIEFGCAPDWSVALEYDHAFMGGQNLAFTAVPIPGSSRTDSISQGIDMITARINYRFGGAVVARY
jgi:outer membrane immunogenic protein